MLGNKFIAGGEFNAKHAWWGNSGGCAMDQSAFFRPLEETNP